MASVTLVDPSFVDAVVLLLDHDSDGTLGVVLNRPSASPVLEPLTEWSAHLSEPAVWHLGGPVEPDAALGVAWLKAGDPPSGVRQIVPRLGLVDLDAPTETVADSLLRLRLFAGYAGWSPGQLKEEVQEGSWHVVPATPADVFTTAPEGLGRRVLRRQPGPMAWLSTRPLDPEVN